MWQVEIRNQFDPEGQTMATTTIKHPVSIGTLIRFEHEGNAVVGAVVQFLIDQTGREFESYVAWIQVTNVRKLNDYDPVDASRS